MYIIDWMSFLKIFRMKRNSQRLTININFILTFVDSTCQTENKYAKLKIRIFLFAFDTHTLRKSATFYNTISFEFARLRT